MRSAANNLSCKNLQSLQIVTNHEDVMQPVQVIDNFGPTGVQLVLIFYVFLYLL